MSTYNKRLLNSLIALCFIIGILGVALASGILSPSQEEIEVSYLSTPFKVDREPTATQPPATATAVPIEPPIEEQSRILYSGVEITNVLSFHLDGRQSPIRISELTDTSDKFVILKTPADIDYTKIGVFSYNVARGNIYLLSEAHVSQPKVEAEYRNSCASPYKKCVWYEIEVELINGHLYFVPHNLGRREDLLK